VPRFSLVIPAYNEMRRLPPYLERARRYLELIFANDYEIIVVDDGSRDGLFEVLGEMAAGWGQLRPIRQPFNRGKGAAVRVGMLAAVGEFVLFTDADGATPIEEEVKLRECLSRGADVAIGSRRIPGRSEGVRRSCFRSSFGHSFSWLVRSLLGIPFHDTQCGFKMFKLDTGKMLFDKSIESGYVFDIHIIVLASRLGCRIAEVPIRWAEVPGSKVRIVSDSFQMFLGLCRIWLSLHAARPLTNMRDSLRSPPHHPL